MEINKWKIIAYIIAIIGILFLGFYIGRTTVKEKEPITIIKYEKGEEIHDSIPYPEPYEVIKPIDTANIIKDCVKNGIYYELFPEKTVVEYIEITKEDTTRIIEDWATKRLYKETLFDIDTLGTCTIDATVQYNRLSLLEYSYIPITKSVETTLYNVKLFSPFIGGGVIGFPYKGGFDLGFSIDGGFFIKEKFGMKLQYGHVFDVEKHDIISASILYKF